MGAIIKKHLVAKVFLVIAAVGFVAFSFYKDHELTSPPDECLSGQPYERVRCLKPYLQNITAKKSAQAATVIAEELIDKEVIDECHGVAHFIGAANFKKQNQNLGKALATCTLGCNDGCVHGTVEAYTAANSDASKIVNEAAHICDGVEVSPEKNKMGSASKEFRLHRQCLHGVGHALIAHNFLSLVGAISVCKSLEDSFPKNLCFGGLFMENMGQRLIFKAERLIEELPNICADVFPLGDHKLSAVCVTEVGKGLMLWTGYDRKKSMELCGSANFSDEYEEVCRKAVDLEAKFGGIGRTPEF